MKFSLFTEEFKKEWESSSSGQTRIEADSTRINAESLADASADKHGQDADTRVNSVVFASETKQSRENTDSNLGVRPLNNKPDRISLFSHVTFTILIIVIVTGALAGAGWYFRDSALADTVINKYLDRQITSGLVGHWTFDGPDMTATTALDKSGNGNTATFVNIATSSRVSGKIGQGLDFRNTTVLDYLNAGSASLFDNMNNLTINVWIKGTNNSGTIIQKAIDGSPLSNRGWRLDVSSGLLPIFTVGTSGTSLTKWGLSTKLADKNWHLLTVTWTGGVTKSSVRVYIDAVDVSYDSGGLEGTGSRGDDSADDLTIGGYASGNGYDYSDSIDDVRIYNRILSQKEITRLYKLGEGTKINVSPNTVVNDGLVGHWTFDGQDITGTSTVLDRSGQSNTATMVNMATSSRVSGKQGQSLNFDGVDDYVLVGDKSSLRNISMMTVSAWIKPKSIGGSTHAIVSKNVATAGWVFAESSGNLYFQKGFSNSPFMGIWQSPTSSLQVGIWQFVAITYDRSSSSNDPLMYINGVPVSVTEALTPSGTSATDVGYDLLAGRTTASGGITFDGLLDDVRIYNRILSADEIAQLYHAGQGVKQGRCGAGNVRDADNNFYNVIEIGTQCWLDRNMNVGTRINLATGQSNNATIEKYCFDDIASNCTDNHPKRPDGGLYTWDEAMQYVTTSGAQGICPVGWHIPSDAEWVTLENFLKNNGSSCNPNRIGEDCSPAGTRLKSSGTSLLEMNLPGWAGTSGSFGNRHSLGYYWSSTENTTEAWFRSLTSAVTVGRDKVTKLRGYSVRCIKDSN